MFGLIPWKKETPTALSQTGTPFEMIRREFDSLFDRFFGAWPGAEGPAWGLDVDDTGTEVVVRAEAPGFQASEFDVQVRGNVLTMTAEHKEEGDDSKDGHRRWSRLQRSVTLPDGVDPNKVEARYVNGVLEVHFEKTPESAPRRIEVKV